MWAPPHTERTLFARLRGLLALAVCLCLTLGLLPAPAQAAGPTGSWTDYAVTTWFDEATPQYTISTAAELAGLAKLSESKNFSGKTITLTANIDLSAHEWKGIGMAHPFEGTFDGGGHTIHRLTISAGTDSCTGFFAQIGSGGVVHGVRLRNASIKATNDFPYLGIVAGRNNGGIYDCAVSGNLSCVEENQSACSVYVGGIAGSNGGTIKNCNAQFSSIAINSAAAASGACYAGGITASGSVENCFAIVDAVTITAATAPKKQYRLAPTANYSYWAATTALDDSVGTSGYTQCYSVTQEQIKGTSGTVINSDGTYANTTSLTTALNGWVAEQAGGGYSAWVLAREGMPYPEAAAPPAYIDVSGPLDETTHQSATGEIQTSMELEGQIQENVTLLSVTLPASIPFIVDVDGAGAFKRVLSATGTLTNRSDCPVDITLTAVTDDGGLLDKVALSLIPDPAPSGDKPQIALTKGAGKSDMLAALAAPTAGASTTATVQVDGTDKLNGASIGSDGDAFVVGLTLKVSKQATPTP